MLENKRSGLSHNEISWFICAHPALDIDNILFYFLSNLCYGNSCLPVCSWQVRAGRWWLQHWGQGEVWGWGAASPVGGKIGALTSKLPAAIVWDLVTAFEVTWAAVGTCWGGAQRCGFVLQNSNNLQASDWSPHEKSVVNVLDWTLLDLSWQPTICVTLGKSVRSSVSSFPFVKCG